MVTERGVAWGAVRLADFRAIYPPNGGGDDALAAYARAGGHVVRWSLPSAIRRGVPRSWHRSSPAPSCWRAPGCWTSAKRPRTGGGETRSPTASKPSGWRRGASWG